MRYLVYLLLVANLGYFAWHWYQPRPAPQAAHPVPLPPDVNQLVLLSERAHAVAAQSDETQGRGDEPRPASGKNAESVAAMEPVTTPEPQPDHETTPPVSAAPTVATPAERVCQTLGPFLKKPDVTSVFALLARNGYTVNVRDGDAREPAGYWVYLPAMQAREARRIVADLDAKGMKDYYIGKRNYISLGIFSERDKAEGRLQQVKQLGYEAILDQRFRTRDVYWLDVEQGDTALLGSEVWKQVQAGHADVRAQRVSCE